LRACPALLPEQRGPLVQAFQQADMNIMRARKSSEEQNKAKTPSSNSPPLPPASSSASPAPLSDTQSSSSSVPANSTAWHTACGVGTSASAKSQDGSPRRSKFFATRSQSSGYKQAKVVQNAAVEPD
jgi:hypothetical protein